jgi:hypothetical protein
VYQLAAAGHGNPEIAQRLFVARRTVESHLASAYRKLSIGSRADLPAALAAAKKSVSLTDAGIPARHDRDGETRIGSRHARDTARAAERTPCAWIRRAYARVNGITLGIAHARNVT